MTICSTGVVTLLTVLGTGCQLRLEEPEAPDTSDVEARYDRPSGLISASDLNELKATFEQRLATFRATGEFERLRTLQDTVGQNEEVFENGEEGNATEKSRLLAVARATHACRGPEGDDVIDASRYGTIHMILKGGRNGLFPVAWGDFDACVDHAEQQPFTIDGSYSITVREQDTDRDVLFIFDGTITTNDMTFSGGLDARVRGGATPEVRLNGAEGDIILSVDSNGQILARDRTGQWTCSTTELQCINDRTGQRVPQ